MQLGSNNAQVAGPFGVGEPRRQRAGLRRNPSGLLRP